MFLFGIKNKNVLFCKDLCCLKTNRTVIMLYWLNDWSAWWTLAHPFFPCGSSLLTSDMFSNATTLNIIRQDDHWEIDLPSLNIHVWQAVILLFRLLCLLPLSLLFLKNLWFQVYSVDVFPIVMTRPKHKTPFVTLLWFYFLCLF